MLTIVTPSTHRMLVTLDSVKADLGVTDGLSDAKLTTYILEASSLLAKRAARVDPDGFAAWQSERVRETLRLDRCVASLVLVRRPVVTIHSVTVDGDAVDTADYERDGRFLFSLSGDERVAWEPFKTVIEYTGGYLMAEGEAITPTPIPSNVPDDLKQACRTMVALRWFAGDRDPALRAQEVPGVGREEYWAGAVPGGSDGGLPPNIADLCMFYRFA